MVRSHPFNTRAAYGVDVATPHVPTIDHRGPDDEVMHGKGGAASRNGLNASSLPVEVQS